jgi:multidrug resistance efflux pump
MMSAFCQFSLPLLVLIALALFVVVLYVSRMCAWHAQHQSTRVAALAHQVP